MSNNEFVDPSVSYERYAMRSLTNEVSIDNYLMGSPSMQKKQFFKLMNKNSKGIDILGCMYDLLLPM